MDKMIKLGPFLFAGSIVVLGIQQLLYLDFVPAR